MKLSTSKVTLWIDECEIDWSVSLGKAQIHQKTLNIYLVKFVLIRFRASVFLSETNDKAVCYKRIKLCHLLLLMRRRLLHNRVNTLSFSWNTEKSFSSIAKFVTNLWQKLLKAVKLFFLIDLLTSTFPVCGCLMTYEAGITPGISCCGIMNSVWWNSALSSSVNITTGLYFPNLSTRKPFVSSREKWIKLIISVAVNGSGRVPLVPYTKCEPLISLVIYEQNKNPCKTLVCLTCYRWREKSRERQREINYRNFLNREADTLHVNRQIREKRRCRWRINGNKFFASINHFRIK